MTWRGLAVLAILAPSACVIPVDTSGAASIPTEIAVSRMRELLPQASYVSCSDPLGSFLQSEMKDWTVDDQGVQFVSRREEKFRLLWSSVRGAELAKVPLRYEVRVFVAVSDNPRKDLYHFSWKEEEPARRAVELFEALRGDR